MYAALELLSTILSLVWDLCLMDWSIHLDVARTSACSMCHMQCWLGMQAACLTLSWWHYPGACFVLQGVRESAEQVCMLQKQAVSGISQNGHGRFSAAVGPWAWSIPLCISVTVYGTELTRHPYQQIHKAIAADTVYTSVLLLWLIGLTTFHKGDLNKYHKN